MSYIQEQKLLQAYKRLFMLGNQPYSNDAAKQGKKLGGAVMHMVGADQQAKTMTDAEKTAMYQKARQNLDARKAKEAADKQQEYDDVQYIKYGPEAREVAEGRAVPTNPGPSAGYSVNWPQVSESQLDRDEAAKNARIAGTYTYQGLKETQKNADDLGHDMTYGQYLRGLGASLPRQPVTNQPGY